MKLFISHSMADKNLIDAIHSIAKSIEIEAVIAEHSIETTKTITEKIESLILDSDFILVLLTSAGFNSQFVQQEIGFAKNKKPILLLVEQGLEKNISGFIYGYDFVSVDPWNPHPAFDRIKEILTIQKQTKDKQDAIAKLILMGLGLFFFAALRSKE